MSYQVEITPAAQRNIKKLPKNIQQQIIEKLENLSLEPRPMGVVKLAAEEDLYRLRMGNYRIIYRIQDPVLSIVITKIGHRKDVYR
jgi:mRNA interferase RelE/StbE